MQETERSFVHNDDYLFLSLRDSFHYENENTLEQLKASYAQMPPMHVASFNVPTTSYNPAQIPKENDK